MKDFETRRKEHEQRIEKLWYPSLRRLCDRFQQELTDLQNEGKDIPFHIHKHFGNIRVALSHFQNAILNQELYQEETPNA
jgi:hypothetical protein